MRKYCKAYHLRDLRQFAGWEEQHPTTIPELADENIVYLWADYTVGTSPIHQDSVLFNHVTPQWQDFCTQQLQFALPEDMRLSHTATPGDASV